MDVIIHKRGFTKKKRFYQEEDVKTKTWQWRNTWKWHKSIKGSYRIEEWYLDKKILKSIKYFTLDTWIKNYINRLKPSNEDLIFHKNWLI